MRELEKQEKELSTQLSGEDKTVTPQASQEDEVIFFFGVREQGLE